MPEIDWKETCMQVLAAIEASQGSVFEEYWLEEGITEAQRAAILLAFDTYQGNS